MRVAFGVSVLARSVQQGGVDGIGPYTGELMAAMPPSAQLQPYLFDAPASLWQGATPAMSFGPFARQALAATLPGGDFGRVRRALCAGIDVIHATDHLVPRLRGTPVVATIFDAIPLSHPEWVRYRFKGLKNELWRRTAFWAQQVITISNYSRQEIATHFRLPEERITAIPLGVGSQWFAPVDESVEKAVRDRHALPDRYFVSVGTLQPRKNISRLLLAHASLPEPLQRQFPLVVVGKPGWGRAQTCPLAAALAGCRSSGGYQACNGLGVPVAPRGIRTAGSGSLCGGGAGGGVQHDLHPGGCGGCGLAD